MAMRDALLPEFDHEMATTRRTLERAPEDKADWKPHEKSMTLGRLAGHLAELPSFGASMFQGDSLDFAPVPGAPPRKPAVMTSRRELLELFDKNVANARAAIASASDEDLRKTWTLLNGGKTLFTLPRIVAVRGFMMNHVIHHRGQFSVYLRLNDVPV